MKWNNPWIDPRVCDLPTEAVRIYLLKHGWKELGPAPNPDFVRFQSPAGQNGARYVLLPPCLDEGPLLQRMIDLLGEVAQFEERWAVDIVTEILATAPEMTPQTTASVRP